MPRRRWWRVLLGNVGLVLGGFVLGLVALEVCLQVAAAVTAGINQPGIPRGPARGRRIVCLGDSNTYGLEVGKQKAYPHVLEQLWNADPIVPPIEVINLGVPSNNSSAVRNRFAEVVETYRPEIVTIMIGVNDTWTVPEPVGSASDDMCTVHGRAPAPADFRTWLWRHSRVFRLFVLMRYDWFAPPESVGGLYQAVPAQVGNAKWASDLQANLKLIVACARRVGAEPILLTYPSKWEPYGGSNDEIRKAARLLGVRLIDVNQAFNPRCPDGDCTLLFRVPDQHPTVEGHELAARTIMAQLREALIGRRAEPAGGPLATQRATPAGSVLDRSAAERPAAARPGGP